MYQAAYFLLISVAGADPAVFQDHAHAASVERAEQLAQDVTITRDSFGIPHVHAKTDAGAVFGGMYARAEDEMLRIELGHAQSMGMASAVAGPAGLSWDRVILAYEVPRLAREQFDSAPPDIRALVTAAADALNLYLERHPGYKPRVIRNWEPWMFMAREYSWPIYHASQDLQRLLTQPPAAPAATDQPDGSNAWAIAPSRTASHRAMLYMNPHIPLDEPYELHLTSDEGLDISGMVAYGGGLLPMIGFNRHLGWSLTVNYPDIADSYVINFDDPSDPTAYRHGDQVRHATTWTATIDVLDGDSTRQEKIDLARTHHGPILWRSGTKAYAVRVPHVEDQRSTEQWYRMAKAQTREQWLAAVSMCNVAFHNLVYADDAGNIGYIYYAAFPVRDPALDYTGLIDGSDPRADWKGYHTLDQIPQVWNPPCGYLFNANSPPMTVTAEGQGIDPAKYPTYMIGKDLVDGRVAMSHDLLSHAENWTLDDLEKAAFDTKVYTFEATRGALDRDFTHVKTAKPELAEHIAPAVELIRAWDGRLNLDTTAGTLVMIWVDRLFTPAWRARRSPGDLCTALAEVMDELAKGPNGSWQIPWGEINRHQRFDSTAQFPVSDDRPSLPIPGGHGGMGVSFCYLAKPAGTPGRTWDETDGVGGGSASSRRYGYHGHSYVGAVEFTSEGPVARAIIPFGQSRDPASPHYNDQAPLYASGKLRPDLFLQDQINAAATRTYHPGQ